ncbi:MAG: excinuclease ABC subunit UvrA, partial [Verrucomicrobia bacterium]|nr:excinuclease ABC subunit UvrA [Verrucomicrobiota bacterium]
NPRSTVGTMTEIHDYLRLLFARVGVPHCPISGEPVKPRSQEGIIRAIQQLEEGARLLILAPIAKSKKGTLIDTFDQLKREGFLRARCDGEWIELEHPPALDGNVTHDLEVVVDRLVLSSDNHSRIAEAVILALEIGKGVCIAHTEEDHLFSLNAYSPVSGCSYPPLEPHDFSFNNPSGMCPQCQGLGVVEEFDEEKVIDPSLSISEDCCCLAGGYETVKWGNIYRNLARLYGFKVTTPWKQLSAEAKHLFLHGMEKKWIRMEFVHPDTGKRWVDRVQWRGVYFEAKRRLAEASSDAYKENMQKWMRKQQCPSCKGSRLAPYPAAAQVGGLTLGQICQMTIFEALQFFQKLQLPPQETLIAEELLKEIDRRLHFLMNVGLHYLTLERTAPSLSGGESQRVRLASQIGCGLVGVTYILDEPSIGLHPRDNKKLLHSLQQLRDQGNTVIVVEHDEETLRAADHIVDFGPGAGVQGGQVLVSGSLEELLAHPTSLTGAYLSGREKIPLFPKRAPKDTHLELIGASHHNLKNVHLKIPLGLFVAITGVSGSGKSSLVLETLYPALANELHKAELEVGKYQELKGIEHLKKVIAIDQSPIGRNPRSNPATYIKLFDLIRDLFTKLPQSLAKGYKAGRFSFNVAEGSCERCLGMGMLKVEMDFLETTWIPCEACDSHRFDQETLSVRFKGKNIYDILEMNVDEALEFFKSHAQIAEKLQTLAEVGLGYIKLGQSSTTLSGGEAQRIKLAKELSRPSQGKTLYLLDEPTTGLHFHDIRHLLNLLHQLVDKGNTVVVIEHNCDLIERADWTIDLGPEGGVEGGYILYEGAPREKEELSTNTPSLSTPSQLTHIKVEEARQNTLKNVFATLPRGQVTCCTGPSGSGKSSFAFDTLYAEGQRRYSESLSPYARQFVHQLPKAKVGKIEGLSPAIALEHKAHAGNPRSTVGTITEIYDFLRILWAHLGTAHCPETKEVIRAISKEHVVARLLETCEGENIEVLAPLKEPSFAQLKKQGFLRIRLNGETHLLEEEVPYNRRQKNRLFLVVDRLKIEQRQRSRLFEAIETAAKVGENLITILHRDEEKLFNLSFSVEKTGKSYPPITPKSFAFNTQEGMCEECEGLGCDSCNEERLHPLARHVLIKNISLGQLCLQPATEALAFLKDLTISEKFLEEVHAQLVSRLQFLVDIGIGHLALHRSAPTLSNGEMQRIRLARQLGSGLTGVLYVLDEPTVGLHPQDIGALSQALKRLKDLGNTLVMVEHDPATVFAADYHLGFGPKAGAEGGHIMARGTPAETFFYVPLPLNPSPRKAKHYLAIKKASSHHLANLSFDLPLGCLTAITGVSGSGKSTLVHRHIKPAFKGETIVLDQNPIGQTHRADVATFCDIAPPLRQLFAQLPQAIVKGLSPGHFSYNHLKGMCRSCWGMGHKRIDMHFLPCVDLLCEGCQGLRLNPLALEVTYKGKSFGQLLELTVDQAHQFFSSFPHIERRLKQLRQVGLGYLKLGQRIQTLSGGEAQRMKLSRELAKRTRGAALYLLDEPTTGLSPEDVKNLLNVLQKLVDKGHTLVVVEHNLDLIASADYLFELGPGAGKAGGLLIAQGTPQEVAALATPTGKALFPLLGVK